MVEPQIRIMTYGDIDFAMRLQDMVGWGNTRADIERSLFYEPKGCFVASVGGEDVGIVNSFLYGEVGFIGNLIVTPDTRRVGIGAALMKTAMDRLRRDGAESILLDGVQKAIPLYERLGFKGEYWSLRYNGIAVKAPHHSIEPLRREDIDKVAELDRCFFGLDRTQKLKRVQHDFPELCFKASKGGVIHGFILAKSGTSNVRVGPWICDPKHSDYAEPLLNALSSAVAGRKIWVGIPEQNKLSLKIITDKSFTQMPSSLRMSYGDNKKVENVSGIYGIGAPDKG